MQFTSCVCCALLAAALSALAPRANANAAEHERLTPEKAASAALARAPAPELMARWRVRFQPRGKKVQEQVWQLRRGQDRIVWSKGVGIDEIWLREASGVALQRVMHAQRHVIEYTAGELRSLAVEPRWRDLGSLFAVQDLAALRRVGSRDGFERRRGTLAGDQVELLWDPRAELPVRLVQSNARGRVVFERVAIEWGAMAATSTPTDSDRIAEYARLDAADFGDMEYNPVVRLATAFDERLGWRRAHRH